MKKTFRSLCATSILALVLLFQGACLSAQGKRVVFIGDSITDGNWGCVYNFKPTSAERSQTDFNHIYGHSYVMLVASDIQSKRPKAGHLFFNRGFSGHKLADLEARWKDDVLDLEPDVVSILVGVNDMGAYMNDRSKDKAPFDFDGWKERYRALLLRTKEKNPSVRLVLCTPFLAREGSTGQRVDYDDRYTMVSRMAGLVRELCAETGATLISFDELFRKLIDSEPVPCYWIWDGVHPTPAGHRKMADLWEKKVKL